MALYFRLEPSLQCQVRAQFGRALQLIGPFRSKNPPHNGTYMLVTSVVVRRAEQNHRLTPSVHIRTKSRESDGSHLLSTNPLSRDALAIYSIHVRVPPPSLEIKSLNREELRTTYIHSARQPSPITTTRGGGGRKRG